MFIICWVCNINLYLRKSVFQFLEFFTQYLFETCAAVAIMMYLYRLKNASSEEGSKEEGCD